MSFELKANHDDVLRPDLAPEHPPHHGFTASDIAANAKLAQLKQSQISIPEDGSKLTTHTGAGVDNTTEWLKAGARGPSDLSDLHGREKVRSSRLACSDRTDPPLRPHVVPAFCAR